MTNKYKTTIHSSPYLSWGLFFLMLVKTHNGVPFQRKTPSDLLKIVKTFTATYKKPHSSK